ncbi:MAG: hypothetical protein PHS30_06565, partial [Bacteroidales bacterium]|nr:hypothetical protein [Bacteroidales bacterium]
SQIKNPQKGIECKESYVYFLKDPCSISADGNIPEGKNIMFGGVLSNKKVGALLPSDYTIDDVKK